MRDKWSRDGQDATPKRLKTTRYHEFQCQICGYTGTRHSTAAMGEAIAMKHAMEGVPQCLPSYRIVFSLSTHLGRIWVGCPSWSNFIDSVGVGLTLVAKAFKERGLDTK